MQKLDIMGATGLAFFGKISASISHEVKNTLAVINENAGLLEDLSIMAEKGMELEPQKVRGLADRILAQVRRSDGIIRNLNRFAHSIDEAGTTVDVGEMTAFTALLAARLASVKGVKLKTPSPEIPVTMVTSPFFLKALIFRCLEFAMIFPGEEKTVLLVSEKSEGGIRIRFSGLKPGIRLEDEIVLTEQDRALLSLFDAELHFDSTAGEITLNISDAGGTVCLPGFRSKEGDPGE